MSEDLKNERPAVYEPHPVSPERKAELRAAGYRIIDAVFAPAGYKHPMPLKAAKAAAKPKADEAAEQ